MVHIVIALHSCVRVEYRPVLVKRGGKAAHRGRRNAGVE